MAAPAVSASELAAARLKAQVAAAMAQGAAADKATAFALVKELYGTWKDPVETLGRAGRAFEGLEALLGAEGFDLEVGKGCVGGWCVDVGARDAQGNSQGRGVQVWVRFVSPACVPLRVWRRVW